jgi:hypothetical protein
MDITTLVKFQAKIWANRQAGWVFSKERVNDSRSHLEGDFLA